MVITPQTAEKILSLASSLHTDAAEVYLRSYTATSVEVKEQKVDAFDRAHDIGAGLRVLVNGHMGFAFTTDLSDKAITVLAEAAVTNARTSEPDPFHAIPEKPSMPYRSVDMFDPEIPQLSEKEKIDRVMALEREAFAVDPRIKRMRKASARDGTPSHRSSRL